MKIIGTDASLNACKAEGYMMMQYDARSKFNVDKEYRLFRYYPEYIDINGMIVDCYYSFNELYELYEASKKEIDSFAETDKFINFENPDYYDFLNLANDIDGYHGL